MRKMVDGIVYDTAQSRFLGSRQKSGFLDLRTPYPTISLYRGKNGRHFAISHWHASKTFVGKCLTGDWRDHYILVPLSEKDAGQEAFEMGIDPQSIGLKEFEAA